MQKIGASTASANALGEFTEGNPGAGVAATLLKAAWLNAIQRELVHLIEGAGLTLNAADDSQLFKAIQAIQASANTWLKLNDKPTTVAGFGITDAFTKAETTSAIQQRIADLVASSPAALDTLKELADALGNDPNFATTMTNALAGKVASDWISTVGLASGDLKQPYMRRASDGAMCFLQPALGITPIQQGGGIGQSTNSVKIGWSQGGLKATVDSTDLGVFWTSQNLNPGLYLQTAQLPRNTAGAGWWRCGDTGIIRQWVQISVGDLTNTLTRNVAWPVQFPSQCSSVVATWVSASNERLSGIYAVRSKDAWGAVFRFWEFESAVQAADLTLFIEAVGY